MIIEKLNDIFEEEFTQRTNELQAQLKVVENELENTQIDLRDLKEKNKKLNSFHNQHKAFEEFKNLINETNFSSIINFFHLKNNNFEIKGMGSEEIPEWFKLLFHYYEDREKLFSLMDLFDYKYPDWAKKYKMPYDYNEKELELFIDPKYDRYITNGEIFDSNVGFFWENIKCNQGETIKILTRQESFRKAIPWQLVLSNPLWKTEKLFNKIIDRLKKGNGDYYFRIQKYIEITKEQSAEMAKYLPKDKLYDTHKIFIECNPNIIKEKSWLAEHFKEKINDNQFSSFYYLNYPLEMQKEFIRNHNRYYTKLDMIKKMDIAKEEKIQFLMEFANKELE